MALRIDRGTFWRDIVSLDDLGGAIPARLVVDPLCVFEFELMRVVPELLCSDMEATKHFYVGLLGFEIKHERPEEKFAYFTREGVDLMCEEIYGPGRRWHTGDMALPLGRGVNFQWEVSNTSKLYEHVKRLSPESIYLDLEEALYRVGDQVVSQRQFVVQDPDGYLFRFCGPPEPNGA